MARTRPTSTTKLSPKWGTSSGTNPGEDFESPQDISDVVGLDTQIPRGSRTPTGGLLPGKPVPRSPVGLEIGKSAGGGLGISVAVPLGGPISARGGINIGEGGAIKGAQVGLGVGVGPIGVSIDVGTDRNDAGEGGCYQYVTVTAGPFAHTYGRNVCEPKIPTPAPAPVPTPAPPPVPETPDTPLPPIIENKYIPDGDPICIAIVGNISNTWQYYSGVSWHCPTQYMNDHLRTVYTYNSNISGDIHPDDEANLEQFDITSLYTSWRLVTESLQTGTAQECSLLEFYSEALLLQPLECVSLEKTVKISGAGNISGIFIWSGSPLVTLRRITAPIVSIESTQTKNSPSSERTPSLDLIEPDTLLLAQGKASHINAYFNIRNALANNRRKDVYTSGREGNGPECISTGGSSYYLQYIVNKFIVVAKKAPLPLSPPVPNSPPKKKMDDKCCKALMLMMLMQHKHLGVTPIPGMEQLDAFAGIKAKGEKFQTEEMAFPFEVPKVWLDPTAKPQDRLSIRNVSELLFVMASQSERLEHVLGTKEFLKDREGQLRGSEIGTIKWLTQRVTGISGNDFTYPDPNDFWFNTDDGIINEKKVEVKSFADAVRYLVESQNRLERILPVAEIKDSTIPARWVYPGKKGQLRVGNLIHLVEYMFRADDRARGFWPQTVKIKDANPAIKGDQKIELKFESQADMLREILKFLIDTEGDGDISNNFALRSAIQNCQQHQLLVQNNAMLDAIVEYMDFKIERTKTKVPMPFSPFAGHQPNLFDKLLTKLGFGNKQIPGSIDKNTEEAVEALFEGVLQNTEVEVPIIKANEKKSMSEAFMEILKHASAASAAVSERVGEGALKRLVDSAGIAQAVSRFLLKRDIAESNGVGDLDQWINSAEAGYTDKPESDLLRFPESNPLEPYDRPIAENPRIREIDTKDPKAD